MSNVGGRGTFWGRIIFSLFALFVFCTLIGCVSYSAYENSPTGIFYPYEPVTVRGRDVNEFLKTHLYTINQPVRISEVGIATYYDAENTGEHEVARLEFSNCSIYVWTSTLCEVGHIEYTGRQTTTSKIVDGFTDFFRSSWEIIKIAFGAIIFLLIISLFSGGGGGTWIGGGTTSTGGSWFGRGTFK